MTEGRIIKVSGPLVVAEGMREANMFDVVRVGKDRLIGEIIEMRGDRASIQVYEETAGLGCGDAVVSTGEPLSVELGPGLMTNIYDGIQRPLEVMYEKYGSNIIKGIDEKPLSRDKKWTFTATVKAGDRVKAGDILGTVNETELVLHKILVPFGKDGTVEEIQSGDFTVTEKIGSIKNDAGKSFDVTLMQKWPVRKARPYASKLAPSEPMVTGQRVIDAMFPIAKGGTACVPGPFGSGKTVVQHQLAKWSNVDIVVYIGCGERGNEMTEVLTEFPELIDPRTGRSIMERTILIANTSNMPVAAREVSLYSGITLAEYFRDMGMNVAIMADSTSRWAEALRELSGRMEEMPAEEGFPAYLPTRLAAFYERAGRTKNLNQLEGSVSIIGAVSPPGGDFSEPVTQHTKRFIRCFWALDRELANSRHYPAIGWIDSYSEYADEVKEWWEKHNPLWSKLRKKSLELLKKEQRLEQIVHLIGPDALPDSDRLVLKVSEMIKNGFLQQNSFDKVDMYCASEKQIMILDYILKYYERCKALLEKNCPLAKVLELKISDEIVRIKYDYENTELEKLQNIQIHIDEQFKELESVYGAS